MGSRKKTTFSYPYARPGVTADVAIVSLEEKPRVLLIQRKGDPFTGSWALPGGYVEENEPLDAAARRELKEETGVEGVELTQLGAFGDPGRDPRGWTITVAYLARVRHDAIDPKAADDAADVAWFSLTELPPLAFDHADIIKLVRQRIR